MSAPPPSAARSGPPPPPSYGVATSSVTPSSVRPRHPPRTAPRGVRPGGRRFGRVPHALPPLRPVRQAGGRIELWDSSRERAVYDDLANLFSIMKVGMDAEDGRHRPISRPRAVTRRLSRPRPSTCSKAPTRGTRWPLRRCVARATADAGHRTTNDSLALQYTSMCNRLLSQYRTATGALFRMDAFTSLADFVREYDVSCPRAIARITAGAPATVLHQGSSRSTAGETAQVAEAVRQRPCRSADSCRQVHLPLTAGARRRRTSSR